MEDDAKRAFAAAGLVIGIVLVGEHAFKQEKSMISQLIRMFRG